MFVICSQPPALSEAGLQVLCPSLNSPVVNLPGLPVGPARSAIVLSAEEYGGLALWVGLRSQDGGQTALFHYQGDLENPVDPHEALERALSFAEGMGFLFDEDLIGAERAGGRAVALQHWLELVGEPPERPAAEPASAHAAVSEASELLLEDLIEIAAPAAAFEPELEIDPDLEIDPEPDLVLDEDLDREAANAASPDPPRVVLPEPAPVDVAERSAAEAPVREPAPQPSAAEAAVPLTKFRLPPPAREAGASIAPDPAAAAELSGGSELGRIPLVRRRMGGETPPRPSLLTRLLGSF